MSYNASIQLTVMIDSRYKKKESVPRKIQGELGLNLTTGEVVYQPPDQCTFGIYLPLEKKPWRAEAGEKYYCIDWNTQEQEFQAVEAFDRRGELHNHRWRVGNYKQTRKEAESLAARANESVYSVFYALQKPQPTSKGEE